MPVRLGIGLEVGQPSDDKAWEGGNTGIIGEELITARKLCGGGMNGIRQLEMCVHTKTSSCDEHLAANRDDLQGR